LISTGLWFAGLMGTSASATLYRIIESAKANNLEPYRYLRLLFEKIPFSSSEDDYKSLLPNRIEWPLLTA
jgi:transposase